MIEKHIVLEDIDPVVFYGVGNSHLQMLKALYPKLRIVARDNVIRVMGDEEQMAAFEECTEKIRLHVVRFNSLKEEDLLDIVKVDARATKCRKAWCATPCQDVPSKPAARTSNYSSTLITTTTWCLQ